MPKSPRPVTKPQLDASLRNALAVQSAKLLRVVVTKDELRHVVRELADLRKRVDALTTATDSYFKRTQDWRQEQVVLKAKVDRLADLLVRKGLVREDELAV